MTCIAAVSDGKKVYIGCDTLASSGSDAIEISCKLVASKECILGVAGDLRVLNALQQSFKAPRRLPFMGTNFYVQKVLAPRIRKFLFSEELTDGNSDPVIKGYSRLLIAVDESIYTQTSDFSIVKRTGSFDSIGSGQPYALGSLLTSEGTQKSAQERLEAALQAAVKYDNGCSGPFKFLST